MHLKIFQGNDYGIYSSSVSSSINNFVYLALKEINLNLDEFVISSSVKISLNNYDKKNEPITLKKTLKKLINN